MIKALLKSGFGAVPPKYMPVNNLSLISKFRENVVLRLNRHVCKCIQPITKETDTVTRVKPYNLDPIGE